VQAAGIARRLRVWPLLAQPFVMAEASFDKLRTRS